MNMSLKEKLSHVSLNGVEAHIGQFADQKIEESVAKLSKLSDIADSISKDVTTIVNNSRTLSIEDINEINNIAGTELKNQFLARFEQKKESFSKLRQNGILDVLVVGAGPAGASSAIYCARKGLKTAIVASRMGGQIMDTLSIENFISVLETEGPKLAAAMEAHVKKNNVPILLETVQKLEKTENGFRLTCESGESLEARAVILACGAKWREMGVKGESTYRAKGICFCPHCDGPLFKGKSVAVIGGGNSGVEAAIDLAGIVKDVTLLEVDPKLRADTVLQEKLKSLPNVTIHTNAQTVEVLGDADKLTGIVWQNRENKEEHTLNLSGLFLQIGLVPNTAWLDDFVSLNDRGEIKVNAKGQTNVEGVFAAGDCTTQAFKQIVISVGSGATAALGAFEYLALK